MARSRGGRRPAIVVRLVEILYVTADMELDSPASLDRIVSALGSAISIHRYDRVDGLHHLTCGVEGEGSPERTVSHVCGLLEGLSPAARRAWDQCTRRVVDLAFESGTEPTCVTYTLPADLVRRAADLGLAIAVTLYRVGFYSGD
jgi:hypothetical protein